MSESRRATSIASPDSSVSDSDDVVKSPLSAPTPFPSLCVAGGSANSSAEWSNTARARGPNATEIERNGSVPSVAFALGVAAGFVVVVAGAPFGDAASSIGIFAVVVVEGSHFT